MIDLSSLKGPVAIVVGSLGIVGCSTAALRSITRRGPERCCSREPNVSLASCEIKTIEGWQEASSSAVGVSLADTAMAYALFVCVLLVLTVVSSPSRTAWDAVADFVLVFESLAMFAFGVYLLIRTRKRFKEILKSRMREIATGDSTGD
jgi:uncharacterized membrane protein